MESVLRKFPEQTTFVAEQNPSKMNSRFALAIFLCCSMGFLGCSDEEEADDIVVDVDGNSYTTVTIGSQTWFAQNLRTSSYANGDPIPHVPDSADWNDLTTEGFCWYDNDAQNDVPCGKLYNWYVIADSRNACPTGWHVPTNDEWEELIDFLGGEDVAGDKLKTTGSLQAGTGQWLGANSGATNEVGFFAAPAGLRYYHAELNYPDFDAMGHGTAWWTSTVNVSNEASGISVGINSLCSLHNSPNVVNNSLGRDLDFSGW
ncbi:MAG: fibrobacter succinogenes major paralogous domain-containing protein [Flavobacteriales bacterium]|nr:fibrobacter succinogenes major paralogous domain-containing protein [Flavobacteriales bacterium]